MFYLFHFASFQICTNNFFIKCLIVSFYVSYLVESRVVPEQYLSDLIFLFVCSVELQQKYVKRLKRFSE